MAYFCEGCFIELDCEFANKTESYCKNPIKTIPEKRCHQCANIDQCPFFHPCTCCQCPAHSVDHFEKKTV